MLFGHGFEHLDATITGVCNIYVPAFVNDQSMEVTEFAIAFTTLPEHGYKIKILVEDLDPVIMDLGHIDVIVGTKRDTAWFSELPWAAAF